MSPEGGAGFLLFPDYVCAALEPRTDASSVKSSLLPLIESIPPCTLLTQGRHSLVNLVDANALVKRGQGSATVMFTCVVEYFIPGFAVGLILYPPTAYPLLGSPLRLVLVR